VIVRQFKQADEAAVIALWNECGLTRPWNDPAKDIAFAVAGPSSTILVLGDTGDILGAVMVGHDGHRGALYYFGVTPSHQGQGLARKLHEAAERWLREKGVWKINLLVRGENEKVAAIYEAMGYERQNVLSLGKRIDQ
jgi:ribosomal protein S18 acetylase RimI-like enzyme